MLDTNALFLPFRTGLDLVAEVERLLPGAELAVPASALGEIDRLESRGIPHAGAARRFAGRFRTVPTRLAGDAAVLEAAEALGGWVLTADRPFGERLRRHGVGTLVPRDRSRLHLLRGERPRSLTSDRPSRGKG